MNPTLYFFAAAFLALNVSTFSADLRIGMIGLDTSHCTEFTRRFNAVEQRLAEAGQSPVDATLNAMEALWAAVKRLE